MLDTVSSLIDYLSEKLRIKRNTFDIYDFEGNLPPLEMKLKDLLIGFGIKKPNVIEGIVKNPNYNAKLADVERFVSSKCNLPDGCFKFNQFGPNTNFGTLQEK